MEFPVYLPVGQFRLHPHFVFEALAYAVGFRWFIHLRKRQGDFLAPYERWAVVAAAIVGAAVGSKLLVWATDPAAAWTHRTDPAFLMGGKTIVGGLLGGLAAVELVKPRLGVTRSTGDAFALPLALGILIGRIGCFLTGLSDRTHGTATRLAWGIDFGDGVARHPTQLYEIGFLAILLVVLARRSWSVPRQGDLFRTFMVGYLAFRFLLGFIQPHVNLAGLSAIQWACAAGLVYYARHLPRLVARKEATVHT